MMTTPTWVLAALYWIHIIATVTWLGSQVILAWAKLQLAGTEPNQVLLGELAQKYQRRLSSAGWLSLLLLAGTGLFQMSSNSNYHGFLAITNTWAAAILIKHGLYALLIGLNLYLTWGLSPALDRTRLRHTRGLTTAAEPAARMQVQEIWLLRANLGITLIILALTAVARSV